MSGVKDQVAGEGVGTSSSSVSETSSSQELSVDEVNE